ncbi:MAG: DUF5367 domain-containing protein [Hyphomonadaceae bacterium]|jgi:hypothetical protein|nr:DUF5367 domain-containing protein [Hyphomonadaceae bacterium]
MILRGMGLGFVLWLINAALFRFAGQHFFTPSVAPPVLMFAITAIIGTAITFVLLKLLREAHGDEGEAAVSVAFPSLLLNALLTYDFATIFPNLDGALDGVYGAMAMVYSAAMVFTGLIMTRLADKDLRL